MTPAKVLIVTPTRGAPSTATCAHAHYIGVRELERRGFVQQQLYYADDICFARANVIHMSLKKAGWDWLLWIDDDVIFDWEIVPAMLDLAEKGGHKFLSAPYPRKRMPIQFPYLPLDEQYASGQLKVDEGLMQVQLVAGGFWLTHRTMLEQMTAHYHEETWASHGHETQIFEEVAGLFDLVRTPEKTLPNGQRFRERYSEDYSFCYRWRQMGGVIHMYVGPGVPLGHLGGFVYKGETPDLGRLR